jgi:sulfate transport system permease protein
MPLHIEQLFQGFNSPGAFAVASVLTFLAVVTLFLKGFVERKARHAVKIAVKDRAT